ncbi:AMP-dependent synthetase [Xylanimonas oleitrophica]|uniref:AMP-dependent synthetase n=1 Tax=Xylanimonas oleitrophica TaxID=2607479 RepID=A0A2W5WUH5_9MICO|nr:AMP-dependent synthetase [Xylanimonas oleitrophica]
MPAVVADLAAGVRAALDGGPAVAPLPRLHDAAPPPGTALVVRTSGSTGAPREVALPGDALRASASATHARLGGPGRWVLALPATHVAGLQVVVRSLLAADAGVPGALVAAEPGGHFDPEAFADLLGPALADDAPVHVSLVPTQLHRLVAAADAGRHRGLSALARCSSVLLGGAATPAPLLARALDAGVPVVRTYGMSETAGGCVYDGVPLDGVRVRLAPVPAPGLLSAPAEGTGVVEIAGPTLATGYLGDEGATAAAFRTDADGPDAGTRWFRTSDLGSLSPARPSSEGRGPRVLTVLGRADDVVVTGGVNVAPAAVEQALVETLPPLLPTGTGPAVEPCVVGVPDDEWGQALVAVVAVPGAGPGLSALAPDALGRVRDAVATRLGTPSAPRRVYLTDALPLRGPGKVDRTGVAAAVRAAEHG